VKVLTGTEAVEIDRTEKRVRIRGQEGIAFLAYDKLILAQGGSPVVPPIEGAASPNVFTIWTIPDMDRIHEFIDSRKPESAVIAGGGFIGLEMAEAFSRRGVATSVVELLPRLMPMLDPEFGALVAQRLEAHGVRVITGQGIKAVHAACSEVELSDGRKLPASLVLLAVGVKPELTLAREAGLEIGKAGGLLVDDRMQTSDPDIYAAGDMVEIRNRVTGASARLPLAGPANRQGRIAASNALGLSQRYGGALGTSVVKVFDAAVASTGLTERAARAAGIDAGAAIVVKDHHAAYYPGSRELTLKIVYERGTGRLLGAQAFGEEGVEKRIDVLATALAGKLTLHEIAELDLAYAPPFSSANDPVNVAAFVGLNDISGFSPVCTASEAKSRISAPAASAPAAGPSAASAPGGTPLLLDVRTLNEFETSHLRSALHIPVDELRFRLEEVPRDRPIIIYCRSGFRGHLALRILKENGFSDVQNLTGGWVAIQAEGGFDFENERA
jgi:NADPH-dependent 2,4-dienoyl-CoA reductase/sulfur reductase-like enzyme/rhodanese-related sulfurtransferase